MNYSKWDCFQNLLETKTNLNTQEHLKTARFYVSKQLHFSTLNCLLCSLYMHFLLPNNLVKLLFCGTICNALNAEVKPAHTANVKVLMRVMWTGFKLLIYSEVPHLPLSIPKQRKQKRKAYSFSGPDTNQVFRCHFTSCTEPFLKCWQGHNTLLSQMAKGNLAESEDMCVGGGGWRGTKALWFQQ